MNLAVSGHQQVATRTFNNFDQRTVVFLLIPGSWIMHRLPQIWPLLVRRSAFTIFIKFVETIRYDTICFLLEDNASRLSNDGEAEVALESLIPEAIQGPALSHPKEMR